MKEGVESLGRVRAQAIVLLVFAFLGGAFIGGTMERVMRPRGLRPAASTTGGPRGGGFSCGGPVAGRGGTRAPGSLPSWYESLSLTVGQRARIEEILKKRSARVDSAMTAACLVMRPAFDSTSKEVDEVLTADQKMQRDSIRAARPTTRGGGRGRPFGRGPDATRPSETKKP